MIGQFDQGCGFYGGFVRKRTAYMSSCNMIHPKCAISEMEILVVVFEKWKLVVTVKMMMKVSVDS